MISYAQQSLLYFYSVTFSHAKWVLYDQSVNFTVFQILNLIIVGVEADDFHFFLHFISFQTIDCKFYGIPVCSKAACNMGNEAVVNTGYTWVTKKNLKTDEVQKILYSK